MRIPISLAFLSLLSMPLSLCSQPYGASAVASITQGAGAGYGFEYLPDNVLGLPDTTARSETPTIDPKQIAAIGLGGEIVLSFDRIIVDGPGPDFTVFENAFFSMLGPVKHVYAEPAEVSVSRDGIVFVSFPFDSLTLDGCAGTGPTNGDRDPGDPVVSGGNSFDLASIGVDSIRFIRLRDVTSIIIDDPSHPFRDPTLNGFDLDAVVAINSVALAPGEAPGSPDMRPSITIIDGQIVIDATDGAPIDLRLCSIDGRCLWSDAIAPGRQVIPLASILQAHGFYLLISMIDGKRTTMKIAR